MRAELGFEFFSEGIGGGQIVRDGEVVEPLPDMRVTSAPCSRRNCW